MAWKVEFYDLKVLKGVNKWPKRLQARFTRVVELIISVGPADIGMPHIKNLGKGLFEVRVKSDERDRKSFILYNKRESYYYLKRIYQEDTKNTKR